VVRLAAALNAPSDWERIALLLTRETTADPPTRLLSAQAREAIGPTNPFARYRELAEEWRGADKVQQMLYADLAVLLPQTFLEKVDRATMAHGVEVRVPFLDADLVEAVVGLPSKVKLPGGRQKALLKAALRNIVPDWVLSAPKQGFGVPSDQWLRGPLNAFAKSVFADPAVRSSGLFDGPALDRCFREHEERTKNWGFTLWKYLHLALWYREYCHAD
jgi:asparagine synthase (glutamine-hydrolysing)